MNKLKLGAMSALLAATLSTTALAGGTVSINLLPVAKIDPALANDTTDGVLTANLYDTLIADKRGGGIRPALAKSYSVSGTTFTFKLRDDVTFSSGNKLTSADVVWSIERLLRINKGYSHLISKSVDSVKAVGSDTVEIKLKERSAPFLNALKRVSIIDSKVAKDKPDAWLNKNAAGSGAYTIKTHDGNTLTVLEKRDHYWAGNNPKAPQTVRVVYGLKAPTVRAKIEKGTHHLSDSWLPPEILKALDKSSKAKVVKQTVGGHFYVKMNAQKPPFDDVNCRKGMVNMFNYDLAIKMKAVGKMVGADPANGVIPKGMPGYDASMPLFKQDMKKAKAYFDKCKYDKSKMDIQLTWVAEIPVEERVALMMQSDLKKLGIKSHITKLPWAKLEEVVSKPETTPHVTQVFAKSLTGDPDALLPMQYSSAQFGTWATSSWWTTPEVEKLLDEARKETNLDKRDKLYQKVNRAIVDGAPAIFGYERVTLYGMSNKIKWPALEDQFKYGYMTGDIGIRFIDIEMK